MQTEKISISLPTSLMQFVENYKISKRCKSRSQVIELALDLLRNKELEQQLLNTLDRWERAYTGYALMAVAPSQQREILIYWK